MKTAEILAVGTELLTPFRSDTNSLYLTGQLNELGIAVRAKAVVRDDRADLESAVRLAISRSDLVIATGGLGPTDDDITRDAAADVLLCPLEEDATILAALHQRFTARGLVMPDINRRQARVPRGASVLANSRGTAPGLWFDRGDQVIVLLPGPPRELQPMFEAHVRPRLLTRVGSQRLRRRVLKIADRAESFVDEIAQPIYAGFRAWPVPIDTTILAAGGQIELHVSAQGHDEPALDAALDRAARLLADALAPAVFSVDGRSIEQVVGHQLRDRGWTIAAAESCTGGLLLARLTDVPGSSAWVTGGVVAYANEVKVRDAGVPQALIDAHGAVSEHVAAAMAEGVARRLDTEVGVGITGIAGPDGGTPLKPVGTVAIAVWVSTGSSVVKTRRFLGDRQTIRQQATLIALEMVRRAVLAR